MKLTITLATANEDPKDEVAYFCATCGKYCDIVYHDGYPYSLCHLDDVIEVHVPTAPDPFRYYGELE
jgi:hypothetical protein